MEFLTLFLRKKLVNRSKMRHEGGVELLQSGGAGVPALFTLLYFSHILVARATRVNFRCCS